MYKKENAWKNPGYVTYKDLMALPHHHQTNRTSRRHFLQHLDATDTSAETKKTYELKRYVDSGKPGG